MRIIMASLAIVLCGTMATTALSADCGLTEQFKHKHKIGTDKKKNPIYRDVPIYGGGKELFFKADMAVNTDGAATSYHPDDPWGTEGLAINTICNGANAIMPGGSKIDYSKCSALIKAFKEAKASGWEDKTKARMDFFAIAHKGHTPCTIAEGTNKGYFVSMTKLPADESKDDCDQGKWLDALELPFIIVPKKSKFIDAGVGQGDLAALYNPATQQLSFAIVGDEGPKAGLAEGSVAVGKILKKKTANPKSRKETYNFGVPGVSVIIWPKSHIDGPYTAASIESAGKKALDTWGGKDRLLSCVTDLSAH